jgi:hypothetical protein
MADGDEIGKANGDVDMKMSRRSLEVSEVLGDGCRAVSV